MSKDGKPTRKLIPFKASYRAKAHIAALPPCCAESLWLSGCATSIIQRGCASRLARLCLAGGKSSCDRKGKAFPHSQAAEPQEGLRLCLKSASGEDERR